MRWASTFLSFASVMTGEGHKEKVKGRGPALTAQRLNTHQEAFTSKEFVIIIIINPCLVKQLKLSFFFYCCFCRKHSVILKIFCFKARVWSFTLSNPSAHGFKYLGKWKMEQNMETRLLLFSCVQLFVIPWTVACQGTLSRVFFRQEYWSA